MSPITSLLIPVIGDIVRQVIRSPGNDASPAEAPLIAAEVVRKVQQSEVVKEVAAKVEHVTNNEPWYQSRVTIGALVSMGTGMAGLFGVAVSPQDAEAIVAICMALGTAAGGAITLYGRWAAKKPIGA